MMRNNILLTSGNLLLLLVIVLFAGCTTHLKNFNMNVPQTVDGKKLPVVMALIFDDNTCQFKVVEKRQGNKRIFHIGPTICDNVSNLLPLVFENVVTVHNEDEASTVKADAIVKIEIIDASVVTRTRMPLTIDSLIVLEMSITNLNGRMVYTNTIKGLGQDARTFGGATQRLQASMQRCLDDLMQKLYEDIRTSPIIRNISDYISCKTL